ncbi:succinate dehydrogenase, hydrophobic membrane anchor protein [Altericroceibacterium xinjiangense]|uniref:succinate dehydrogenase, hydrophobic membrane anchor protein n=1 Tax=Altericroceibacterium xinjiangense TaxID=762261 RepID=UPI000F7F4009|nr:succinate dehydrogenase, hydrophobic membrane anchor protein [Altericroceibacterium xinjiangense]
MGNGTELGRVRGLGSAHHGAHDWRLMRYTSAASLVLVGFLLFSFLLLPDLSYLSVRVWMAQPLVATALALLVIAVFWHSRLGVVELIGDYVHDGGNKFAAIMAVNLLTVGGAAFGLVSIGRVAFGALPA